MRIVPIITALCVVVAIFLFVFQRDLLVGDGSEDPVQTAATPSDETAPKNTDDETTDDLVSVVVQRSTAQFVDSVVAVRGQTEAARQVNLLAETSGSVVSAPLRKGTFVTAGQEMCRLDSGTREVTLAETEARLAEARARVPEAEARVIEAEARLDEALINDRAASKLSQGGFASETRVAAATAATKSAKAGVAAAKSGLQSTLAGIQSAEAAVAAAEKEIERLVIHASFDGILESDTAELGGLLQPGALCATVIQLDPIKLVGFVPEIDVSRIDLGALSGARLSDGTDVQGKITFISRSADKTTRTFRVEVEIPNSDFTIRDGQTAEILIQAKGSQAHFLPGSALTLNDAGTLGLRLIDDNNIVQFTPVKLIRDTTQGVWLSGLPDTASVIVVGQEFVVDGVKVAPSFRGTNQ